MAVPRGILVKLAPLPTKDAAETVPVPKLADWLFNLLITWADEETNPLALILTVFPVIWVVIPKPSPAIVRSSVLRSISVSPNELEIDNVWLRLDTVEAIEALKLVLAVAAEEDRLLILVLTAEMLASKCASTDADKLVISEDSPDSIATLWAWAEELRAESAAWKSEVKSELRFTLAVWAEADKLEISEDSPDSIASLCVWAELERFVTSASVANWASKEELNASEALTLSSKASIVESIEAETLEISEDKSDSIATLWICAEELKLEILASKWASTEADKLEMLVLTTLMFASKWASTEADKLEMSDVTSLYRFTLAVAADADRAVMLASKCESIDELNAEYPVTSLMVTWLDPETKVGLFRIFANSIDEACTLVMLDPSP